MARLLSGNNMNQRVIIGAVSYLNTKPLVHRLAEWAPHAQLVYDLPSRLADRLAGGDLDVALIPSVEFLRQPEYTIVSDACIACRGPVFSVKLYCRVAPQHIETLALDEGSRTSVALAQILLAERFGVRPALLPLPIGHSLRDTSADAVLLIGDRAMQTPDDDYVQIWDLGDVWCRWSELPFVFAMWTARADRPLPGIAHALAMARESGVESLDEISAHEASSVGLPIGQCLSYLRDNLYFYLGPRELRGLELFAAHAARFGLAPPEREIRFHGCEAT
jgi:chorismate dehydratase